MKSFPLIFLAAALLTIWNHYTGTSVSAGDMKTAPEFPSQEAGRWINSAPLKMTGNGENGLRGKVVLLNVWTFLCWNCANSYPWVREVQKRFAGKGLVIVGIHSPEFDRERDAKAVQAAADKNMLTYPHYIDNDFAYWKALKNRYWPAFYLIDKKGLIRALEVGEMHSATSRAKKFEEQIQALLLE